MVTYMENPQNKVTVDATVYEVTGLNLNVVRVENGLDMATIEIPDEENTRYPSPITSGKTYKIEVKGLSEESWFNVSEGRVRFVHLNMGQKGWVNTLKCLGAAYGLSRSSCGEEYGSQSRNAGLDTITEILTDNSKGVIPRWVNKVMNSDVNSGYSYTTSNVASIANVIPYLRFNIKPCDKVMNDLCDVVTALRRGNPGCHWIVTPSSDLRVKLIDGTQAGWTKYYGNSQANATLEEGVDFELFDFEKLDIEANYVIYNGVLRKPPQDIWTEADNQQWYLDNWYKSADVDVTYGAQKVIGDYSLYFVMTLTTTGTFSYPHDRDAAWNLQNLGSMKNPPLINFYARESKAWDYIKLRLETTPGTAYYEVNIQPKFPGADTWVHFSYPIGPYYRSNLKADELFTWGVTGSPSWSNINCITFALDSPGTASGFIDDLHFEGTICRVAKNSTSITNNKLAVKLITDNIGKDDSMKATDDSGAIAKLVYAELLRCQTTPIVGYVITPMIKDLLPGQWLHIHAKKKANDTFCIDTDMRVTKVVHDISEHGYWSTIYLTDDLTNACPRPAFDDVNRVLGAVRPEFQDRQATQIKAGEIDIEMAFLEKDYPS